MSTQLDIFSEPVEIPLSQGFVALVDSADADWALQFKWHATVMGKCVYAARAASHHRVNGRRTRLNPEEPWIILMHRALMKAPTGTEIDHANGDGLDNRRVNLRICTHSENLRNASRRRDNSSGFKGVGWHRAAGKWSARIAGKHLGLFVDLEEAARAYDDAALQIFGRFARLNFPR